MQDDPRYFIDKPFHYFRYVLGIKYIIPELREAIKIMLKNKKVFCKAGHGIGKCLGKNTGVMMSDGRIKKVQNIKVGDSVMGSDSLPRKVVGTNSGYDDLYKVSYRDGTGYIVNSEHMLSLVASQTHGKQKSGEITNITVRDYLKWSKRKKRTNIGYKTKIEFEEKELPINPYILGIWLGDGDSFRSQITTIDKEILNAWENEALERGLEIKDRNKHRYHISSGRDQKVVNTLLNDLKDLGLIKNKHIPFLYKQSSIKQRLQLLAGLLDTDGNFNKSNFEIIQKNKTLAHDIQRLAQSVGCHSTLKKVKKYYYYKGRKKEREYFRVNIFRNINQIPCRLTRKKANIQNEQRKNLHFGISIEYIGKGEYFGFQLEGPDKLFVLEDFTVTHNSHLAAALALWFHCTRYNSLVYTTAPSQRQVDDIIWREIGAMHTNAEVELDGKVYKNSLAISNEWQMKGFSSREAVNFQGRHAKYMMWIVDEADGIDKDKWEAIQSNTTGSENYLFAIGNPVDGESYFRTLQDKFPELTIQISSYQSPNIQKIEDNYIGKELIPGCATLDWIEGFKDEFGEDSNTFKSRVLAEYPDGSPESLLTRSEVINCSLVPKIEKDWVIFGIDPAYMGGDESVIVFLSGNSFYGTYAKYKKIKGKKLFEEIKKWETYFKVKENKTLVTLAWDKSGIGTAVSEYIEEHYFDKPVNLLPIGFGDSPTDWRVEAKRDYIHLMKNKRAEMHFDFRRKVRDQSIYIPKTYELEKIATKIHYKIDPIGDFIVEPKESIKKKLGKSPDLLDAMILALHAKILGYTFGQKPQDVLIS